MYCIQCGSEIPAGSKFCPNCGAFAVDAPVRECQPTQVEASSIEDMPTVTPPKRKKHKLLRFGIIALIVVVALIVIIALVFGGNSYVETVQNGYLGEYTDITVQELLDGHYSMLYDEITWDGGETDAGKNIVQVKYQDSTGLMDDATIQFTMLDEQRFEITAFVDPLESIGQSSDLLAALNYIYLEQYAVQHQDQVGNSEFEAELMERLEEISGSAVLYGASADYKGDRSQLYTAFGDSDLGLVNVVRLLDYYGLLGTSYYDVDDAAESDAVGIETFDGNQLGASSENQIRTAGGIMLKTDLYTLVFPLDWEGRCIYELNETGSYEYSVSFCEYQSYSDFGGYGGELFAIRIMSTRDFEDFPSYSLLGTLSVNGIGPYYIVVLYPTDVEFSDVGMNDYNDMSEDIADILKTFTARNDAGVTFQSNATTSSTGWENFLGEWGDFVSQRCYMTIDYSNDGLLYIKINWSSSASENTVWIMSSVNYNEATGTLEYTNGLCREDVYGDGGGLVSENVRYTDGTGSIWFNQDGYLCWTDNKEHTGDHCLFEKLPIY